MAFLRITLRGSAAHRRTARETHVAKQDTKEGSSSRPLDDKLNKLRPTTKVYTARLTPSVERERERARERDRQATATSHAGVLLTIRN